MKSITLKSASLLFFLLFSASFVYSQSSSEYKSKIEALNKEMAKNMVAGNSDQLLGMYTNDAISLPSYEPMHEGLAAIKQASADMAKNGMKFTLFEPTVKKVMVNGNMITEIGTYKVTMKMPNMDKPMDDHGKYLTIWEKQSDGSLKIKVETWNSDVNPMEMMNNGTDQKKQ